MARNYKPPGTGPEFKEPKKKKPPPQDAHDRHPPNAPVGGKPKPAPAPAVPAPRNPDRDQGRLRNRGTTNPSGSAPPASSGTSQARNRQQELRNAGYAVAVDGVWGASSQQAWNDYQHKLAVLRGGSSSVAAPKVPAKPHVPGTTASAIDAARVKLPAVDAEARLHLLLMKAQHGDAVDAPERPHEVGRAVPDTFDLGRRRTVAERQAVQAERQRAIVFARKARAKAPEKWTTRELLALTTDPLTGHFDPRNPAHVRQVQRWLRSHGHPGLALDGTFGPTTYAAFQQSIDLFAVQQRHAQIERIVTDFYDTGAVSAKNPLPFVGVPKPGQLLKLLQDPKNTADAAWLLRELVRRTKQHGAYYAEPNFARWRAAFLKGQAHELYGPLFHNFAGSQDYLLATLPGGYLLRGAHTFEEALTLLHKHERWQVQQNALDDEKRRAANEPGFWGGVLDKTVDIVDGPGEWTRTQLVSFGALIQDQYDRAVSEAVIGHAPPRSRQQVGIPLFVPDSLERVYVDYSVAVQNGRQVLADFERDHPWKNLIFEVVVDPLNLVPGRLYVSAAKVPLRAALVTVRGLERWGVKLEETGRIALLPAAHVLQTPHELGVLAGEGLERARFIVDDAFTRIVNSPTPLAPLYQAYRHGTTLKTVALENARRRARAFVARGIVGGIRGGEGGVAFKVPKEIADTFTYTERQAINQLDKPLQRWVRAAVDTQVSLFSHENLEVPSRAGYRLQARMNEEIRVAHVERWATEKADDAHRASVAQGLTDDEAADIWRETYLLSKERAVGYVLGGADPRILEELGDAVAYDQDTFRHTILRLLQKTIDEGVSVKGGQLFGEAGEALIPDFVEGKLLSLALEAFNPENTISVRNWLWERGADGEWRPRPFTRDEMWRIRQHELDAYESQLNGYAATVNAAGGTVDEQWVAAKLQERFVEQDHAWRLDDAGWVDTREFRDVPTIYARNLLHLFGDDLASLAGRGVDSVSKLREVSASPAGAESPAVAIELTQLAAWITGLPERRVLDPRTPEDIAASASDRVGAEDRQLFREAIVSHDQAVREVYNHALSQALYDEGAVWQALRHAQSWRFRALYYGGVASVAPWRFATLALRPGWVARNVYDNTLKTLLAGVHNPAKLFLGGEKVGSVFDADIRAVRYVARFLDGLFGTESHRYLEKALDEVLSLSSSILSRIFGSHGIAVPEHLLDNARFRPLEEGTKMALPKSIDRTKAEQVEKWWSSFRDGIWELMANRPENFAKRALYRSVYQRTFKRTGDEAQAAIEAWAKVEATLFDYSKITVVEDNLRVFFPFIQFWRKNTVFWARTFAEKPWFLADVVEYSQGASDIHQEQGWPEWMSRYISAKEASDVVARVPGLAWLAPHLSSSDTMYDPLNFFSFSPLYRAFKSQNQLLPEEEAGLPFLGGLIDGINDFGLSLNPFVRKPLEWAGILNRRDWQTIFPQTALVEAFTRKYLNDRFPDGLNLEAMLVDPLLERVGVKGIEELRASDFEQYVRMEIANQRARGERVNRGAAEEKIRDFFYVQAVWGYFAGVYARRMTPEDFHLSQIADQLRLQQLDYRGLSQRDKDAYQLWKRRNPDKFDELAYTSYLIAAPLVQAYYRIHDFEDRETFLQQHPEILPYVSFAWQHKLPTSTFVNTQRLVADTESAIKLFRLVDTLDLDPETSKLAEDFLVTPELRAFWRGNDTRKKVREAMMRAAYQRHLMRLNELYWSLPKTDFKARQSFLDDNPILQHWWDHNNSRADDLQTIVNAAGSTLRDHYFEILEAGDGRDGTTDWNGAAAFLRRFPWIFDGTKLEGRHDANGDWIAGSGGHGPHGLSQHARDYRAAAKWLHYYFGLVDAGKREEANGWLNGGTDGASVVRAYFAKYAHHGSGGGHGQSQHAIDYLRARSALKFYFALPKAKRRDWLSGKSHAAEVVRWYFKRYGHQNKIARGWSAAELKSANPELNRRLIFWQRYFSLPPNKRPLYAAQNAVKYGVFVYGELGAEQQHDAEQEWLRKAAAHGARSEKAALTLRVIPLIQAFYKIKKPADRALFLKVFPELADYFDRFSHHTFTKDKKLNGLLERYFDLPSDSEARSRFLVKHPEVQDYFDEKASPAARAMRNLLEVYFGLPSGRPRKDFLAKHPEIQAYFDQRAAERDLRRVELQGLDRLDPRLAPFFEDGEAVINAGAEHMRQVLLLGKLRRLAPDTLETRRDRRQLP